MLLSWTAPELFVRIAVASVVQDGWLSLPFGECLLCSYSAVCSVAAMAA